MSAVVVPSSMPDLGVVDDGRWQEQGITHWHLTHTEFATNNTRERYDPGRWAQIVGARDVEVSHDPDQALEWLVMRRLKTLAEVREPEAVAKRAGWATEQDWRSSVEMTWWMLTHVGGVAGGGIAIGGNRSVELYANPMTERTCRRHTR